ncbi:hypothetical protein [Microbacterium caowuchunii]|uniref:Uncharacterized protein n=1 Tax=Microbacterium caowuchunii TaxID=2614638 RepID=A0A5N0TLJ6_9MICO|nr:hypothetical protein [Microbacterium caowuchunii]KAA9134836.1 hypothetical protein F6B40_03825 [Microbacterium caowuchunii]
MAQRHLRAFNRAVKARRLDTSDEAAPLVELGRDLARSLDADGVAVRSVSAYRAVLKEIRRYEAIPSPRARRTPGGTTENGVESGAVSDFGSFKRRRNGAQQ